MELLALRAKAFATIVKFMEEVVNEKQSTLSSCRLRTKAQLKNSHQVCVLAVGYLTVRLWQRAYMWNILVGGGGEVIIASTHSVIYVNII